MHKLKLKQIEYHGIHLTLPQTSFIVLPGIRVYVLNLADEVSAESSTTLLRGPGAGGLKWVQFLKKKFVA